MKWRDVIYTGKKLESVDEEKEIICGFGQMQLEWNVISDMNWN